MFRERTEMRLLRMSIFSALICIFNATSHAEDICQSIRAIDINRCADRLGSDADMKLNFEYLELKKTILPIYTNELVGIQRRWLKYRDSSCAVAGDVQDLGSEAYSEKMRCLVNITSHRVAELMLMNHKFYSDGFYESKKFYEKKYDQSLEQYLSDMMKHQPANDDWRRYANENCGLIKKISGESLENCMARMVFQTLRN
jgi:uncharacterized protein YecT (DUF1311 family)